MTNIKGQHNNKSKLQNMRIRVSDLYSKKRFWNDYICRFGTNKQVFPTDGMSYILSVICGSGYDRIFKETLANQGMDAYQHERARLVFKYLSYHHGFVPQCPSYTIIDYVYDLMNMCNQPARDVISFLTASDKWFNDLIRVLTQIDQSVHWYNVTPLQFAAMCNHEFSKKLKSYAETMRESIYAKRY